MCLLCKTCKSATEKHKNLVIGFQKNELHCLVDVEHASQGIEREYSELGGKLLVLASCCLKLGNSHELLVVV